MTAAGGGEAKQEIGLALGSGRGSTSLSGNSETTFDAGRNGDDNGATRRDKTRERNV